MGSHSPGNAARLIIISLLAFIALSGAAPSAMQPAVARAAESAERVAFGPQLYLIGPCPLLSEIPPSMPATIHAALYDEEPNRYIASADPDLPDWAAERNIPAVLVDADTAGKVYYFADALADGAREAVSRFGTIIYGDEQQLLVAVPGENEPELLDALPGQGIGLSLLSPNAIVAITKSGSTTFLPLITSQMTASQIAGSPIAKPLPQIPTQATANQIADSSIATLLPLVTTEAITDRIAELSGERGADTGGGMVTLATRYTFAAGVRDAERHLYQYYVDLKVPVAFTNWSYGGYSGHSVVAEIRGSVHPERIWLVGGHFDNTSEIPYTRAPGADDNASGIAATLVIADILRSHRFSDTIRFVHFSAEEQGHWGSQAYARSLYTAGAQVMGFIDLDMIGWDGDGDRTVEIHSGTRANSVSLASRFTAANQRYGQGLRVEVKSTSASRFSDHSSFWDYSYPAFMVIENFFDDSIVRDRNPWYHKTGDLLSRVNLDYVVRTTRTALAMLAEAAVIDPAPLPTVTPSPSPTPTRADATPSPTPTSAACSESVANGGFEANAAWTFAATANPAGYITAQAHTGARSARLGVVPAGYSTAALAASNLVPLSVRERNLLGELAPLGASYSTAYQTITVPAGARTATLSFWHRPGSQASAGDFQRVMLLKPVTYSVIATVWKTLANSTAWQHTTFDLSPYRGQSIVLYFEVYNDDISAGARTWMYVDDVSVQVCSEATATSTSTRTATLAPTSTWTPTPIPIASSSTPTPTSTLTATPSPLPTPTATAAPSDTPTVTPIASTATPTPTSTLTATSSPSPTLTVTTAPSDTPTATPTPFACTERVGNGGFEANATWTFAITGNTGDYTTAQTHSGARSARLGVSPAANSAGKIRTQAPSELRRETDRNLLGELAPLGASYSTVYQTVSIPSGAGSVTLTYWYQPGTQATGGDFQRVMLLQPGSYSVLKTLMKTLSGVGEWRQSRFDLSGYRGQSVVVYFEVYNDDVSSVQRTWMFVDDVSIEACNASTSSTIW